MSQTIAVVDEDGNVYHPTYAKRARGLVKSGRARWLNENCICLACPPMKEEQREENVMTNQTAGCEARVNQLDTQEPRQEKDDISVQKLLEQLISIQQDVEYVHRALDALIAMDDGDSGVMGAPGNILGANKAEAIGVVVRSREETNQMLLRLYERMYDDLMRQRGLRAAPDAGNEQ